MCVLAVPPGHVTLVLGLHKLLLQALFTATHSFRHCIKGDLALDDTAQRVTRVLGGTAQRLARALGTVVHRVTRAQGTKWRCTERDKGARRRCTERDKGTR